MKYNKLSFPCPLNNSSILNNKYNRDIAHVKDMGLTFDAFFVELSTAVKRPLQVFLQIIFSCTSLGTRWTMEKRLASVLHVHVTLKRLLVSE